MKIIIIYDLHQDNNYNKRYNEVRKICLKYGSRVQKSVYLCEVNINEENEIISKLKEKTIQEDNIQILKIKSIINIQNNHNIKDYLHDLLIY